MNELDIQMEILKMERELRERTRTDRDGTSLSSSAVGALAEPAPPERGRKAPLTPGEFRYAEALLTWSRGL